MRHATQSRSTGPVIMARLADARFWWVLAVAATMWSCTETMGQERPPVLTGPRFKAELDKPISIARDSVTHDGTELRPLLQRVTQERGVALVLDRRVDPGRRIGLDLPPLRLRDALARIAAEADCLTIVAGDTAFIGPRTGTDKLRTLIALRENELGEASAQPGWRELELRRAWTFAWTDLDRPSDLVLIAAQHWTLEVEGLDQVPHDLWAAGMLAGVNAVEALSVLLVQFDLTFEWTADRTGVRIMPVPDTVAITRTHTVRRITAARAFERIRELFPELDVQVQGRELVATGTAEQQDVVARLARGESPHEPDPQPVDFGPLRRRRFTIHVVSRPIEAVLQTLAANGIEVRYDVDQFKAGGIDLSKQISFDLKDATVEELFNAICEPAGLRFAVQDETVTLSGE